MSNLFAQNYENEIFQSLSYSLYAKVFLCQISFSDMLACGYCPNMAGIALFFLLIFFKNYATILYFRNRKIKNG